MTRSFAPLLLVLVAPLFPLLVASPARAESTLVHVVRPGETLASIADRYYGNPKRENVLVSENGLTSEGGSAIVVGLRLSIPTVSYYRVQAGDTWAELAQRFYGDPKRAFVLIEANQGGPQPDTAAEVLVPYPLRHVVSQSESLRAVAKTYYEDKKGLRVLRRFNLLKTFRVQRGDILLVPLPDLVLSQEGRRIAKLEGGLATPRGDVRAKQALITEQLPELRERVRNGRFTEAVALANRLIGMGDLTGNQVVTIQRELGTALVALDRNEAAQAAFAEALKQQPDMELDLARTSPKVRAVFEMARSRASQEGDARRAAPGELEGRKRKRGS
ncbi:MAG: LysM domain-containing protein [Myxococcales bacterium]|nr:LysM domain-containing protein [Myxococcales bacterium]MDD9971691.1 LysM domain-containing protein [Myxococcales bacterium]